MTITLAAASLLAMGGRGTQGDPIEVARGVMTLCAEALRHLERTTARDHRCPDFGAYSREAAESIGLVADAMEDALADFPTPDVVRDRAAYDPSP